MNWINSHSQVDEGGTFWVQGRINHWANWAFALLGASRLHIKKLVYWRFMFLRCSLRVKSVEQGWGTYLLSRAA